MATVLRGRLNYKRVASYFKRGGLTVHVERAGGGEFVLTDRLVMVRCLPDHEIALWTNFPDEWEVARFDGGKGPAQQASVAGAARFWGNTMAGEWHPLALTHELRETPVEERGKPGTMWRKFTHEDASSYFNKRILDMISPDLDELADFQFEQAVGENTPMRIAAVYGYVALVMPGRNIESR